MLAVPLGDDVDPLFMYWRCVLAETIGRRRLWFVCLIRCVFFSFFGQVKEKGYAVVVVAEGAGEEVLGQTGETDATG